MHAGNGAQQNVLIILSHIMVLRWLEGCEPRTDYVQVASGGVDALLDTLLARARLLQELAKRSESLDPSASAAQQPPTLG